MIPRDYITEWRAIAPWVEDSQVEQDLVISRALVEIFSHPELAAALAFRGGTALHKLHVKPPARYSEDIDLVQVKAGAIGPTLTALHKTLDPWLGEPQHSRSEGRVTLNYRFASEDTPPLRLRLKVEINSREHFTVFGVKKVAFDVDSRWFRGSAKIVTYELKELLGTKLRALYQRKKGRDLFDLAVALETTSVDPEGIAEAFAAYMKHEGKRITRAQFEQNLTAKLRSAQFAADIQPLLASAYTWERDKAAEIVLQRLVALLPGAPWKGRSEKRGKQRPG
ncbi:MAG: nucleotidyl transferase AbiEii/AbiGii toxin family protein [Candidatus Acidiferrales bacterium]